MSIVTQKTVKTLFGAAAVTIAAGLLYFSTAARDIVVGDSPELIAVAVTLGVPHAPGYPLFTMLGHIFSLIPFGPVPFRVNLLSTACDALTVGVVYLTARRLTQTRIAAAVAAILLAANPTFWSWSLQAEVFPLNNLLVSLVLYLLIAWYDAPNRKGLLIAASFIFGLALSNHQTSILLAPTICFLLWNRRAAWRRPELVFTCTAAIAAGFLPYLYVPWAAQHNPFFNWGGVSSLSDLFALVARLSYGTGRLTNTAGFFAGSPWQRIFALCRSLGPLMGLFVILGLVHSYRKQRWYFWFALLGFCGIGVLFVSLANLDLDKDVFGSYVLERFFLASQVVLAPLSALGILSVGEWISVRRPPVKKSITRLLAAATLIAILVSVGINYRKIDQSNNHIARLYAEDVFATAPPKSTLLINGDENVLPLGYMQAVEKLRADLNLVIMPLLQADWYLPELRQRYQALFVPFDRYDPAQDNLKKLVEANRTQSIIVVGRIPNNDDSLKADYWFYRRGLVTVLEPKGTAISIDQAAFDNEQLLSSYRLPDWRAIKKKSFESNYLLSYAVPSAQLGREYERLGDKPAAEKWYRRALNIDPYIPEVREGLARIGN